MSPDAVEKLWEELTKKHLGHLVHGSTAVEKLGAIVAIGACQNHAFVSITLKPVIEQLMQEDSPEIKRNCFRFFNYVKTGLPFPDYAVMQAAATALGKIVEVGVSTMFDDSFMRSEVDAAIQLLQTENSRYAGVLILKELALHNPTAFYPLVSHVLDKIIILLRDPRAVVREAAAELLAACLDIVTQRARSSKTPFLIKILQAAQAGLRVSVVETLHGSLLTLRELLLHAGMFMKDTYVETADSIFELRGHRDVLIRKTVIALIPTLALYDTQTFSEYYLHKAMSHLLEQLPKPVEQWAAFVAIGQIATSVGCDMKPFLEPIMDQIKQGLQQKGWVLQIWLIMVVL